MKRVGLALAFLLCAAAPIYAACSGGCPKGIGIVYPIALYYGQGLLTDGEPVCAFISNTATIPANLLRSGCSATAFAASNAVFTITDTPKGGSPYTIATMTVRAGNSTCTLSSQAAISVQKNDTICATGPFPHDSSLAGVALTIYSSTTDYP